MTHRRGFEFIGDIRADEEEVLSEAALDFLADLVDRFADRRADLLTAREAWQAKIDAGALPDFRKDTAEIRAGDWKVGPLPPALRDRRVEITGPTDRKMVINALNADVKIFMADFEDALSPSWRNVIEGQVNLRDAARRDISYEDPKSGKKYALGDNPATLLARVRGLHLDEKHVLRNGRPIPGCLFDFAVYFHNNHQTLTELGLGPYFYVPEARTCRGGALVERGLYRGGGALWRSGGDHQGHHADRDPAGGL